MPPQATETISYGIPAFKESRVLLWFAAFADHCSVFPTAAVVDALKDDLKGYAASKGTVHFPLDKPLPAALVKKMIRLRLAQTQKKRSR